jgi:hypothetical protein
MRWIPALALGLFACNGAPNDQFTFSGFDMTDYFAFDGERTWEYISSDTSVAYFWVAELSQDVEEVDGKKVYTVDTTKDCVGNDPTCVEGELVRSLRWSVDATDGVEIHSYAIGTDARVDLSPPLQLATAKMKKEDVVETTTDGTDFSSTFASIETCPVQWNVEWDDCIRFDLDDGDGDLSVGHPLTGQFWVITGFNLVAQSVPGESGRWELSDHDYSE